VWPSGGVDNMHRGRAVAWAALAGALGHVTRAGGGLVEAVSEVAGHATPKELSSLNVTRGRGEATLGGSSKGPQGAGDVSADAGCPVRHQQRKHFMYCAA
jgi:hypothetical protein